MAQNKMAHDKAKVEQGGGVGRVSNRKESTTAMNFAMRRG